MSHISSSLKRKAEVSGKSAAAVLTELCTQEKVYPTFEDIFSNINSKEFTCIASAFGIYAKGVGSSKKEAKQNSSAKLLEQLATLDRFKGKIETVSTIQRPKFDGDAVIKLMEICVQREWPLAKFDLLEAGGPPHDPVFTFVCQVSSVKRTGNGRTKKIAKQVAAHAVLDIVQNFKDDEENQQIALVTAEPVEKIFKSYYAVVKQNTISKKDVLLRDRHKFYTSLPQEDQDEAKRILMNSTDTDRDIVDLACAALKIEYAVQDIPNHSKRFKVFFLRGNHDCVIMGKEDDLFAMVIEHFKTMLNIQQY